MRLLFLDQFSDPGGAQQVLLELLPAIRERGWSATVGLPGQGELFERVRSLGFKAERIDCGPYNSGRKSAPDMARFVREVPRLSRQIADLARRSKADLLYVNGPRLIPAVTRAWLPQPILFHAHSYLRAGALRSFIGLCFRGMQAWVLGSCRFVSDPWRDYVGEDHIRVVYNGVAGPLADQASARHPRTAPVIGCIGRIAPEKGQREFVVSAAKIHAAIPQCRFQIYGAPLFSDVASSRYDAEVRAAASSLPVEFAGWVANPYDALANLDLLLVPSAGHEATTRVILEAFASGVPVIAFRSGGIPEVIDHGVNGLLCDSPDEMARLSIELLTGGQSRVIGMSRAARESWQHRFTLDGFHRQVLDLLQKVAGTSEVPSNPYAPVRHP